MSKAEERANEKYPLMQDGDKEGLEALKYIGMEFDSVYDYNSVRYSQQAYFIEGYQQAEKDLKLTWEDIRELYIIFAEVDTEIELCKTNITAETLGYYQEILKRFKEMKESTNGE